MLTLGGMFPQAGKIGAIEAKFNNKTGNIPFRADFPNPDGLLLHGDTGAVLIHQVLKGAIVIPQRATFKIGDKRYVYVVDKGDVVHRARDRSPGARNRKNIYVIKKGVGVGDKIVLEGVRQVRDGEKVEYEFRSPDEVIGKRKSRWPNVLPRCHPPRPSGAATANTNRIPLSSASRFHPSES